MDEIWPEKGFGMHCLDVVAQVCQVDPCKKQNNFIWDKTNTIEMDEAISSSLVAMQLFHGTNWVRETRPEKE